jgi:dTDP-4-dehydrorhamnose 3,5-epimerase
MDFIKSKLADAYIIKPKRFSDVRGWFETQFITVMFQQITGQSCTLEQLNYSFSTIGTLRGLHIQLDPPQAKLIKVLSGVIYDVIVDLRFDSVTFGEWEGITMDAARSELRWVPEGFAHGFYCQQSAHVCYMATATWNSAGEKSILWNDAELQIKWPVMDNVVPILSNKDLNAISFYAFRSTTHSR